MFHVTARHWDLKHSCNTDLRIMLNCIKRVFENKFLRFLKFLNTSADHGGNVHRENNSFYVADNRSKFVFSGTGVYSAHKDESKFLEISFTAICRSPGGER